MHLQHDAEPRAQLAQPHAPHVEAVDADAPRLGLDESQQRRHQRRLAAARAPHDARVLARRERERDVAQRERQLGPVAQRDAREAHRAVRRPLLGRRVERRETPVAAVAAAAAAAAVAVVVAVAVAIVGGRGGDRGGERAETRARRRRDGEALFAVDAAVAPVAVDGGEVLLDGEKVAQQRVEAPRDRERVPAVRGRGGGHKHLQGGAQPPGRGRVTARRKSGETGSPEPPDAV